MSYDDGYDTMRSSVVLIYYQNISPLIDDDGVVITSRQGKFIVTEVWGFPISSTKKIPYPFFRGPVSTSLVGHLGKFLSVNIIHNTQLATLGGTEIYYFINCRHII